MAAYRDGRPDRLGVRDCFAGIRCSSGQPPRSCSRLRAFASEVPLTVGESRLRRRRSSGRLTRFSRENVRLESPDQAPILASAGATFGVADTLAGTPSGWRAVATTDGRALRLDRDDLFGVMADHVDLMQNLFTEALRAS